MFASRAGCIEWRHRGGLVGQWGMVVRALTVPLLSNLYGAGYQHALKPSLAIPRDMDYACLVQVWYRMLHILGGCMCCAVIAILLKPIQPGNVHFFVCGAIFMKPEKLTQNKIPKPFYPRNFFSLGHCSSKK